MRNFLTRAGYKLRVFMQGRYGADELSRAISVFSIAALFLSLFIPFGLFLWLAVMALTGWSLYRSLSRDVWKRQRELRKYLILREKARQKRLLLKNMWRYRKTHRYYRCPGCRATVRVAKPGRHGTMTVTCPQCRTAFRKRV